MKQTPAMLHDPTPPPASVDGIAGDLRREGFARYGAAGLGLPPGAYGAELAALNDAYAAPPPDPYAPRTNRFRRYSHAVYLPWARQLSFVPGTPDDTHGTVTEYWQDEHNPEYPDMRRRLPTSPRRCRTTRSCCT